MLTITTRVDPTVDKRAWGDGPWVAEPDYLHWIDAKTGLDCLIVRNTVGSGALCGYVGVPMTHPCFGLDYDTVDGMGPDGIHAHGGLTFSGLCHETEDGIGICHTMRSSSSK